MNPLAASFAFVSILGLFVGTGMMLGATASSGAAIQNGYGVGSPVAFEGPAASVVVAGR